MTGKAKSARTAKVRKKAGEPVGMRAELEKFKRERILEEMVELFNERGFHGATLDALAARLQVTKPFIYQFFDSKQQLIATVYERGVRQLLASIDSHLGTEAPASKRLYEFVYGFALQNIESRAISVVFGQEEGEVPQEALESIRGLQRDFDTKLASLIEDGVRTKEFVVDEPHLAGLAISGMVRWIYRWFREGRLDAEQVASLFANYALNLVGYQGPRSF